MKKSSFVSTTTATRRFVCAGMAALMAAATAVADTETVDGIEWTYSISNGKATIGIDSARAIPNDTAGDIVIPSTLGGCAVTSIGYNAFNGCGSLTSVVVPEGVTDIGAGAFRSCWSLSSITFPDSLVSIGDTAFYSCGLLSVTLPKSVASLQRPFYGCGKLAEISISPENGFYAVRNGVLFSKDGKTLVSYPAGSESASYAIPDDVESLAAYSFADSANLVSVTIPDSVTNMEDGVFCSCHSLASIVIPDSVVSDLGSEMFRNCYKLTSVKIGSNVTGITGHASFADCGALESIVIPASVREIGWQAFACCYALSEITLTEGLSSIGYEAFYACPALSRIVLPDSLSSISGNAFEYCSGLTSMTVPYAFKDAAHKWGLPEACEIVVRDKIPLAITTDATLPDALTDESYWQPLAAAGGLSPYTWEIVDEGGWPDWLNQDGIYYWESWGYETPYISCWPYEYNTGTYTFSLRVTDAEGMSAEKAFTLKVKKNPNRAPVIDSTDPSDFDLTTALEQTFSIEAHDPEGKELTYRWYVYDSDWNYVPGWEGVPAGPAVEVSFPGEGNYRVEANVSDGQMSIWVGYWWVFARDIPVVETAELPAATEGVAYSATLAAHGGRAPYAWSAAQSGSLPAGLSISGDGVLSGTPDEPGEHVFTVAVTDDAGETGTMTYTLAVAENGTLRPGFATLTPEAGYVNMGAETERTFAVKTTHPAGGEVTVEWFLDGELVGTGAAFDYSRGDDAMHTLRVVASAGDLPKTAVREWKVGSMYFAEEPADMTIPYGKNLSLDASGWFVSSTSAKITWYQAPWDENGPEPYDVAIGEGARLCLPSIEVARKYYAQLDGPLGRVRSRVFKVLPDPVPAVERIYKMTGPAFAGNRLVLRAKPYGDLSGATYAWKRDGRVVATTERLDIPALAAADFGTYTFTVTTPYGTATSEAYVLEQALAGVPYGWGADGHGRTTAPEGLGGVVQVASGMNFNLGLAADGTVTAWGFNGHGGCDVPAGLADVSFVAAGGYESHGAGFAVRRDGTVVAWGQPYKAHSSGSISGYDSVGEMPAGLADVVQVAVGAYGAIALRADGTVVTWGCEGFNWDAWCDFDYSVPKDVADVVAVASGGTYVMALRADGTVAQWGCDDLSYYILPEDLGDAVAIDACPSSWGGEAFAIRADGSIVASGQESGWDYSLTQVPSSRAGFASLDIGQDHGIALDNNGQVSVWGYTNTWNYSLGVIPAAVKAGALGVAAGGYHCTVILADTDGDTIADAEERLIGRDPAVREDAGRVDMSGRVTIDGADGAAGAVVALYDASGARRAKAEADEDGRYAISGLVPGLYFVKIEADGAVDAWLDGVRPSFETPAPFSTYGGDRDDADFDLAPGQAPAYARVVAHRVPEDASWWNDDCEVVSLPDGTQFYLDLWPVTPADSGLIDLGEAPASHSAIYWETEPHIVSVKLPGGGQVPAPCEVEGAELDTVEANPHFSVDSGSVHVVTEPAGAEVWIDYADKSLGVTPLTVGNVAAASHAHMLLLKKDGFLRPRPIWFGVNADETTEVSVTLTSDGEGGGSVAVSSAIPDCPIYLDYLPTGETTPATIRGLDPASHAGDLWHSAPHTILLRHPSFSPFAPRIVPAVKLDPETGLPAETPSLHIDAPNTYEWDDVERADFGVTLVEVPKLLYGGGAATARWSVTNAGVVAATAPWKERVSLVTGAGPAMVAEVTATAGLDAGASVVRTATFDIPAGLVAGGGARLRVEIDPEGVVPQKRGGLSDTATSASIPFALPDLGVAWTAVPEALPVGGTVELGWTVGNTGLDIAAAPWTERVWLVDAEGESILSAKNGEGVEVPVPAVATNITGGIAVGGEIARTLSLAINPGWFVGTDVWFKVDIDPETAPLQRDVAPDSAPDSAIAEAPSAFVTPDLGVSWTLSPAAEGGLLPLGGEVSFGWTVTNAGQAATYAPWTERVWLRNGAGEFPAYEATVSDVLASGASVGRTASAVVPWAAMLGGAAEIRVEIDREGRILQNPDMLANAAAAGNWDFSSDGWKVVAHAGTISGSETWGADAVHIVSGTVTVATGARLTIDPGAIVKFMDGARLVVASGATCVANGAIFTHIADDTVGGDTMGDGGATAPAAGAYAIEGDIQMDETTERRWMPPEKVSGTLYGAKRWRGHNVYRVVGNLTLASGCTLTIDAGAIVKFNADCSLTVASGATLDVRGTRAQPVFLTSAMDDSVGGDTDGEAAEPRPGDWRYVWVYGKANLSYATVLYGGSSELPNDAGERGPLMTHNSGALAANGCVIAKSKFDGIWNWGGSVAVTNSVFAELGWAAAPYRGSRNEYVNCVFYGNDVAVCYWPQWTGHPVFKNCVFAKCGHGWCERASGNYGDPPAGVVVANCLFWNPPGKGLQSSQKVGTNGNVWGDPLFDFEGESIPTRIEAFVVRDGSPCIDAGDSSYAPPCDALGRPRMDVRDVADTGRPDADGICADIGLYEVTGVAAASLPNLAVLSVVAPASARAGDVVTVEYVVTNRGMEAVSALVRDTIRLKGDASAGGATVEAGTVAQSYNLPVGGAAVMVTARVTVPGVASGAWTFGVDVNLERDVYEQNVSDNRAWAGEATAVAADSLPMGVSEKLVPGGKTVGYALDGLPPDGGAVIVRGANAATLSARGAIGAVPVSGGGTPGVALPDGSLLVILPARDEGRIAYLAIENGGLSAAGVSVEVVDASPRLLGVSPTRIANEGTAALTLYGVGLSGATGATLAGRAASALEPAGSARLLATFSADGLKTGSAAVAVAVPGAAAPSGAVEIFTTRMGPKLVAWLDMPSNVRDARVFAASVRYRNDGDTAMPMPCFKVFRDNSDHSTLLGLERNEMPSATALHVGGVSPTAPAGVLKPGDEGVVPFYFVPRGSYEIHLEHVLESASAVSTFPAFGGPEGYFEAVSAAATRLGLRSACAYDLQKCVDLALRVRNGTPCAAATGRLLDAATAAPLAGVEIALVAADAGSGLPGATAKTAADGSFSLDGLADGDYRWLLGNGATLDAASTNVVAVADQADLNGLEVLAMPGGRISGHVVCADGVPVAGGTVILLDSCRAVAGATETDAFGHFAFAELAPGSWAVQSAPADGWCAALATNLVVGAGARAAEATLVPVRGAVLRGTVALADGSAVTNGTIQAISGEGVSYDAAVGADGTWLIPGLPEGDWVVRHYAADMLSPDGIVELVAGDEVELALVTAERPLFVPTLSVGFGSCETTFVFADRRRAENITSWSWDFDSDGNPDSDEAQPTHRYEELGTNTVTLVFVENGETRTSVYENCVRVEEPVETVLKPGAIVFGENSGSLEVVEVADGALVLSGEPEAGTLEEGAVILGQFGGEWFCRRVVSAGNAGGTWSLQTEEASLLDVYSSYAFSCSAPVEFDDAEEDAAAEGASTPRAAAGENPGRGRTSRKAKAYAEGGLNLSFTYEPDARLECVRRIKDGCNYERVALVGSIRVGLGASFDGVVGANYAKPFKVPLTLVLPTPIPGVTAEASGKATLTVDAHIKGSGAVEGGMDLTLTGGVESYDGESYRMLPPFDATPYHEEPHLSGEGSLSAKLSFGPEFKIKLLKTADVVIRPESYVKLEGVLATDKPASLELNTGVGATAEANLVDWDWGWFEVKLGVSGTYEGPKYNIFSFTGPDPDFDYSPSSGIGTSTAVRFANQSKGETIRVLRASTTYEPAGFEWDFGNGMTSDATNPGATFDREGRYDVSLKASGQFITGPNRKRRTVTVGRPDDIPDDGSRRKDDSQHDRTKQSQDPNEIVGPNGQGADKLVTPGQWMNYTIYFENHEGEDVADAYKIYVTNSLSPQLDWATFEMGDVVFGADDRTIDGLRRKGGSSGEWSADVPLTDGSEVKVSAKLTYDADTGLAVWYLRIVDPDGIQGWPEDGSGFLPSNDDTHRGEGRITYRVKVREDAAIGASIDASATIVFDENAPIPTDPAWRNTVGTLDEPLPVFRFYSKNYKGHFFTIDEAEKDGLIAGNPNWKFEGTAYRAYTNEATRTVALYRFYSKGYRGHFFTIDADEAETVKRNPNWKYEGIAYYVYPDEVEGSVPVFRFWSKRYRHHFYTIDEAEKNNLIKTNPNWKYEGIAFYALPAEEARSAAKGRGIDTIDGNDKIAINATNATNAINATSAINAINGGANGFSSGNCASPVEGIGVVGPWSLAAWPDCEPVAPEGVTAICGLVVEASADAPDAAELDGSEGEAFGDVLPLLLALPDGAWRATLRSAIDGTIAGEDAAGVFGFTLPANGAWHWLRVRDAGDDAADTDADAFSIWLRAK